MYHQFDNHIYSSSACMILTMNKTRISYVALTFDPRPQIMKSDVQKYNKCMPVCQQRANSSLQLRYFRQPTQ